METVQRLPGSHDFVEEWPCQSQTGYMGMKNTPNHTCPLRHCCKQVTHGEELQQHQHRPWHFGPSKIPLTSFFLPSDSPERASERESRNLPLVQIRETETCHLPTFICCPELMGNICWEHTGHIRWQQGGESIPSGIPALWSHVLGRSCDLQIKHFFFFFKADMITFLISLFHTK